MAQRLFLLLLVAGCARASSPVPGVPSPNEPAQLRPGDAEVDRPEAESPQHALPPLPADLEAPFAEVHALVTRHHAAPKPELDRPFATKEEHQAWVDRELEPWRERGWQDVGKPLGAVRPELDPTADLTDAEWVAHQRARLVYGALSATLAVDEAVVRARIPFPDDVRESDPAAIREYAALTLNRAHEQAELWRSSCTVFDGGDRPVPEDLQPWVEHCAGLVATLSAAACDAERRVGLPASVPCNGERPIHAPKRRAPGKARSMQDLTRLVEQIMELCWLAEDLLDDAAPGKPPTPKQWRAQFASRGIDHPEILEVVDAAIAERSAAKLVEGLGPLAPPDWKCAAAETLVSGP